MNNLISGEKIEVPIQLNPNEIQNEEVLLTNHCLITSKDFNFKVIGNKTLNFKYRGNIWLLNNRIIFKGFEIIEFYGEKNNHDSKEYNLVCNLDYSNPINIEISLDQIYEFSTGHDKIFKKRYFMNPKLKISLNQDKKNQIYYILFAEDDLLINSDKLKNMLTNWSIELGKYIPLRKQEENFVDETEIITQLSGMLSDEEDISTPGKSITTIPIYEKPKTKIPVPDESQIKNSKQNEIYKTKVVGMKTARISSPPLAAPIETENRPKPRIGRVIIESEPDERRVIKKDKPISPILKPDKTKIEDSEDKNILYEVLKPEESINDNFTELTSIQPDSSITRCKKCGWIIKYDQLKCPRCGEDTY
jgi:predicted Zn-ribbon and HTH transcriptional regulator